MIPQGPKVQVYLQAMAKFFTSPIPKFKMNMTPKSEKAYRNFDTRAISTNVDTQMTHEPKVTLLDMFHSPLADTFIWKPGFFEKIKSFTFFLQMSSGGPELIDCGLNHSGNLYKLTKAHLEGVRK